MAKLIAGITGWGRGAVAGLQMQTMRGKTFIRAKQPPLGPGTAVQQAYRKKFSFIQSNMKWPSGVISLQSAYFSSVPLDQRNAVLKQNLAKWPWIKTANRGIFFDDFLWKLGAFETRDNGDGYAQIWLDAFTAPPNGSIYSYTVYAKHSDGTVKKTAGTSTSSGVHILELDEQFYFSGKQVVSILFIIWRYLSTSSRPYVVNSGEITSFDDGNLVYGNFTMKRLKSHS